MTRESANAEPTILRPTSSGTVRFAAFYASMIAVPLALTWLLIEGPGAAFTALAAGYLVAGIGFALLVRAGWYRLQLTDAGIHTRALGRSSRLPRDDIDHIETGHFFGREIWVRVVGRSDRSEKAPALAVLPAFLFGMSAPELRDLLSIRLGVRTE